MSRVGDDALGTFVAREIRAEGVRVVAIRDPDAPDRADAQGAPQRAAVAGALLPGGQRGLAAVAGRRRRGRRRDRRGGRAAPDRHHRRARRLPAGRGRTGDGGGPGRRARWCPSTSTTGRPCGATRRPRRCSPASPRPPTWSSPDRRRPRWCSAARPDRPRSTRVSCWRGSWPSAARPPWWSSSVHSERWRCPGDEAHRAPALPVEVVDPVGAGDAFVAGYLSEVVAGRDRCPTPCARRTPAARRSAACPATGKACPPAPSCGPGRQRRGTAMTRGAP